MDYRNIVKFNKKQFEYACNKHGLDIYNVTKGITEKVLFQKTNNTKTSQDKASIFYYADGSIKKGDILKFNDEYYITINMNYPENEAWRNSTLIKCNTVWNLFGETLPIVSSDLSSPNPRNGIIGGVINLYTQDIPLLHKKLNVNDYFYDFGGCYKLINKFYVDGLAYLYFQRDTHNQNINYTLKNANNTTAVTKPTELKFYLSCESSDKSYYLPTAEITYTSSDETIAKVENGYIIPVSEGAVTITASCKYVFENGNSVTSGTTYTLEQTFTIGAVEPEPEDPESGDSGTTEPEEPENITTLSLSTTTTSIAMGTTRKIIKTEKTDAEGNAIAITEIPSATFMILSDGRDATEWITIDDTYNNSNIGTKYAFKLADETDYPELYNYVNDTLRVTLTYSDGLTGYIDFTITY